MIGFGPYLFSPLPTTWLLACMKEPGIGRTNDFVMTAMEGDQRGAVSVDRCFTMC